MTQKQQMSLADIESLSNDVLTRSGATPTNAAPLANAIMQAERDGISSHGLMYLPIYAEHLKCGKVIGDASPVLTTPSSGVVVVDAANGFAHPAISLGIDSLVSSARKNGIGCLSIYNSYNCGVLGHHAERIASNNLFSLCFTNSPASIVPVGGTVPIIGTNPFALAAPDADGNSIMVIDQSASVIAKSEVVKRAKAGESVPEGWVLDSAGNPTTDPAEGLKGSMAPSGGYKGVGIGLLVELFAACLSGANLGIDASPFSGTDGGPPSTGQFMLAIDSASTSNNNFTDRLLRLSSAITSQDGARLPGSSRFVARAKSQKDGVMVDSALLQRISEI